MCIFSGRVRSVSDTNIFARLSGRGTQFLVYSMKYSSDKPVAMILPLPVASPQRRMGIRFISFKSYGDFFNDLENGFPEPPPPERAGPMVASASMAARPTIRVESVGDFIASYVPTLDDFDRVDRRFRLPRSVWDKIPAYADYGFAVFQLKETARGLGVHPMAFEFHTRFAGTLYFPTVHIHDEQVHLEEAFDHTLYLQDTHVGLDGRGAKVSGPIASAMGLFRGFGGDKGTLRASAGAASGFVECPKTQGAVEPNFTCFKLTLKGDLPNKDTLIRVG